MGQSSAGTLSTAGIGNSDSLGIAKPAGATINEDIDQIAQPEETEEKIDEPGPQVKVLNLQPNFSFEYEKGLKFCTNRASKKTNLGIASKPPYQLMDYTGLGIQDIIQAIAAIEVGLYRNDDEGVRYSFGDANLYHIARHQRQVGLACVGSTESLIMPLIFDESSEDLRPEVWVNQEPSPAETFSQFQFKKINQTYNLKPPKIVHHTNLAVASYNDTGIVKIMYYYDKKIAGEKKVLIRRTARNIVRNSGWLRDTWPNLKGHEIWVGLTQRGDTSGIHVILNAWATMAEMEVSKIPPCDWEMSPDFYPEALKLVNLGLEGKIDIGTIRDFLQCYGYARQPRKGPVITEEKLQTRSVLMNSSVLDEFIRKMHRREHSKGHSKTHPRRILKPKTIDPISIWEDELDERLARHRMQFHQKGAAPPGFASLSNLQWDDTVTAIASIWEALRQAGTEFAFAASSQFQLIQLSKSPVETATVVLGPKPLIIPLLLATEDLNSIHSTISHLIFALATRDSTDGQHVKISFKDSLPRFASIERKKEAAKKVVERSGWMGLDAKGHALPTTPRYTFTEYKVPGQEGENTCGFYQILNAWMHMLNIPTRTERSQRTSFEDFHKDGLEMVQLAMAGCMDSETIQAFVNAHGYSKAQCPSDHKLLVQHIEAVALTNPTLETLIARIKVENRTEEHWANDPTLQDLLEMGFNPQRAREALMATSETATVSDAVRYLVGS